MGGVLDGARPNPALPSVGNGWARFCAVISASERLLVEALALWPLAGHARDATGRLRWLIPLLYRHQAYLHS